MPGRPGRLKFESNGIGRERTDRRVGVAAEEDDGIVIILVIRAPQGRVLVEHVALGLDAVVRNQFAGDPDPLAAGETADLRLRIGEKLLVDILDLPGLDVEFALKDLGGAEGADARLVTLDGGEVIGAALLEELLRKGCVLRVWSGGLFGHDSLGGFILRGLLVAAGCDGQHEGGSRKDSKKLFHICNN